MSLAFDEFGKPYIIVREQEKKRRVKGIEAIKQNLTAALSVANMVKTSFGPKGMDKMIVSPDGEPIITNDGATIMEKAEIAHPISKLIVELSMSQDNEIGDGTTGIVILAGLLIEQALYLLDKGIHPLQISSGFDKACDLGIAYLDTLKEEKLYSTKEDLVQASKIALSSKVVSSCKEELAQIAAEAVLSVADMERKEVNLELIKIVGKTGRSLQDTSLINGILIDKEFSHPQMIKRIENAKVAILTCPFEPPKPKTKYNLNITNAQDYNKLASQEQEYFVDMVKRVKESGAQVALCQWGFDDEANHLLIKSELNAVRWISGTDVELLAMATGAKIVPRFEELSLEKLGTVGLIEELQHGTTNENMIVFKELQHSKAVSILIRGGSKTIIDEAHRSIHDALCVIRNLIKNPQVIVGGGASELAVSIYLRKQADEISGVQQYAIRSFAQALEQIPLILAENSGMHANEALHKAKARQIEESNPKIGVSCLTASVENMQEQGVFETLVSKKHQIQLATQVVKMILKIDDLIENISI